MANLSSTQPKLMAQLVSTYHTQCYKHNDNRPHTMRMCECNIQTRTANVMCNSNHDIQNYMSTSVPPCVDMLCACAVHAQPQKHNGKDVTESALSVEGWVTESHVAIEDGLQNYTSNLGRLAFRATLTLVA